MNQGPGTKCFFVSFRFSSDNNNFVSVNIVPAEQTFRFHQNEKQILFRTGYFIYEKTRINLFYQFYCLFCAYIINNYRLSLCIGSEP